MDTEINVARPGEIEIAQECLRLKAQVAEVRDRASRLRELADHLEARANQDEAYLGQMEAALGVAAQLQLDQLDPDLGGRRLQEVAVAVLAQKLQAGQAIHYRDWYELLQAAGYRARGKNPLASFLAQVSRAKQVEPVGARSGEYRLRSAA